MEGRLLPAWGKKVNTIKTKFFLRGVGEYFQAVEKNWKIKNHRVKKV